MSTLMFWNRQNSNNNNSSNNNNEVKNGKRNWLHSPASLLNGHVVYLVKYFGSTPVEQPKGIEVVKDAIRRLQFAQQMKKAETGSNAQIKKVEITISVDGVAIQEPRTQKVLHQFPLHNISYCADEEGVKKFFSFIAKSGTSSNTQNNTGNEADETHECFVFISSKLASDITLTIGQAFDLAYRRFMTDSTKGSELGKAQTQIKQLEGTVATYRLRLKELSDLVPKADLERLLSRLGIRDICEMTHDVNTNSVTVNNNIQNANNKQKENGQEESLLIETSNTYFTALAPRNIQNQINDTLGALKTNGQKAEELLLNSDSDSDFDPRADENSGNPTDDLFGFEPQKTFGQQLFSNNSNASTNNNNNNTSSKITYNNGAPQTSPPPLLAPPPKVAAPRRGNSVTNQLNGNQDLFGSTPFNPNDTTSFDDAFNVKKPSPIDDFSLESLDPLRK